MKQQFTTLVISKQFTKKPIQSSHTYILIYPSYQTWKSLRTHRPPPGPLIPLILMLWCNSNFRYFSYKISVNEMHGCICAAAVLFVHARLICWALAPAVAVLLRLRALWHGRGVEVSTPGGLLDIRFMSDKPQNVISCSWSHCRYFLTIESRSVHKFLSC